MVLWLAAGFSGSCATRREASRSITREASLTNSEIDCQAPRQKTLAHSLSVIGV
jgi:hypothetical protein